VIFKGIVHVKTNVLSLTHSHGVPNPYDFWRIMTILKHTTFLLYLLFTVQLKWLGTEGKKQVVHKTQALYFKFSKSMTLLILNVIILLCGDLNQLLS